MPRPSSQPTHGVVGVYVDLSHETPLLRRVRRAVADANNTVCRYSCDVIHYCLRTEFSYCAVRDQGLDMPCVTIAGREAVS
jgi:hypothetical protein